MVSVGELKKSLERVTREIVALGTVKHGLASDLRFFSGYAGRVYRILEKRGEPMSLAALLQALDKDGGIKAKGNNRRTVVCRALERCEALKRFPGGWGLETWDS